MVSKFIYTSLYVSVNESGIMIYVWLNRAVAELIQKGFLEALKS